ncbi:MAG: hypothetical protein LBI70_03305 [Rickettsiales bacterium]|jgi:hypothetical protein|nr:hypothetical protein [Rickettsiales bacterium]
MDENILEFLHYSDVDHEQSLWKAVILQAFVDLKNNSKKKIANTHRVKAVLWFNLSNRDFLTVCGFANLNPDYVWSRANAIKETAPLVRHGQQNKAPLGRDVRNLLVFRGT